MTALDDLEQTSQKLDKIEEGLKGYNPDQPRDEGGRFASMGGGGGHATSTGKAGPRRKVQRGVTNLHRIIKKVATGNDPNKKDVLQALAGSVDVTYRGHPTEAKRGETPPRTRSRDTSHIKNGPRRDAQRSVGNLNRMGAQEEPAGKGHQGNLNPKTGQRGAPRQSGGSAASKAEYAKLQAHADRVSKAASAAARKTDRAYLAYQRNGTAENKAAFEKAKLAEEKHGPKVREATQAVTRHPEHQSRNPEHVATPTKVNRTAKPAPKKHTVADMTEVRGTGFGVNKRRNLGNIPFRAKKELDELQGLIEDTKGEVKKYQD